MPPKGRKKVVTETKNGIYNGAGEVLQVDEVADVGLKELNAQNKIGKSQSGKGRKKTKIVDNEESTEISSNGQISTDVAEEKTKENSSAPAKRGKKKTESKPDDQISTKQDEAQEPKEKSFKPIEQEEKVAPAKRGRKKAEIQSENEISVKQDKMGVPTREKLPDPILDENTNSKVDIDQAKVVPAKRGRKKAEIKSDFQTSVKQRKLEHNEKTFVVEKISAIEVEIPDSEANVVVAKRGRKKAESKDYQTSVKQRKIEHNENTFVVEKVPGSKKREEGDPLNPAPKENEECNTLTSDPRKIRSGRSDKKTEVLTQGAAIKNVSTAVGGRKRKGEEKTDRKEAKKGKSCAEIPDQKSKSSETEMDNTKHLRVTLQRNLELEEMALLQTEGETKVKSGKGPSKGKGKRANPNGTDSKPEKIPKESTSKSKGSAKKDKIPDVTVLDFGNTSTSPDGKPWNLKIASWNINGIRAWLEKNGMSYLHHEKPDVLCVQETKCSDDKLPDDVKVDGYHCYWLAGDKEGYSGVGLLSKEKPISVRNGIGIEEHDNDGRAITAEYEKFYLVTAYVPNSGRGLVRLNYRIQWDKDFRDYLKKLDEKKPVVLCGDLNVAHEEMDLANPKTNKKNAGFTKEERDAFSTLLSEGFIDTFRHLYPDTKAAYTFWTYMMNARAKNVGWRLDYFVISKKFTNYLCDSVIRKDVFGSDHCPIGLFLHV